ncbi:MAG: hypothetical protein MN733_06560 [Nitrososphaera sp.]|nr:hypothetical protein [Nitrososphaera sp.]
MISLLDTINARIAKFEKNYTRRRETLLSEKTQIIRAYILRCVHCKDESALAEWGFIRDHYYVKPYSCTGGDYWVACKTDVCHLVCLKCRQENYIYNHPDRKQIVDLIDNQDIASNLIFATIWSRHGKHKIEQIHPKPRK